MKHWQVLVTLDGVEIMPERAQKERRAQQRAGAARGQPFEGDRLFPALGIRSAQSRSEVFRVASTGGLLAVQMRNSGLSPTFQPYVELVRLTFRLHPPAPPARGLFVWQERDGSHGHWRRPRRGEVLGPSSRVNTTEPRPSTSPGPGTPTFSGSSTGEGQFPEFLTGEDVAPLEVSVLAQVAPGQLAPGESVAVQMTAPPTTTPDKAEGIWAWCLALRCFDVVQDPAPPLRLPTPRQASHHTTLICLHDIDD